MENYRVRNDVNEFELSKNFDEACKDSKFKRLVGQLKVSKDVAMKYTSSLQDTVSELNNCSNCPGLVACKNRLEGHVMFPKKDSDQLIFLYAPCKYQKEFVKKQESVMSRDKDLENACFADIDLNDKTC